MRANEIKLSDWVQISGEWYVVDDILVEIDQDTGTEIDRGWVVPSCGSAIFHTDYVQDHHTPSEHEAWLAEQEQQP